VGELVKTNKGKPSNLDTVREFALSLADVEEGTSYCTPAFRARGNLFLRAWEDNDVLVVRVDPECRDEMIEADPETYFLTDHYLNYPWILVRLSLINREALRDLISMAWKLATQKPTKSRRKLSKSV
jgi:hypothetical protein